MTDPAQPSADQPTQSGLTLRRTWPVWANEVQHRVDVDLNAVTGSTRVYVDGQEVTRRSPWHMDASGFELPFDVDGRPCLLVVRSKYGAQPEFELYSEGRSLTTGEELADHRQAARRELPNIVRMLLLFIPLIGGLNTVVQQRDRFGDAFGGMGPWILIGVGVVVAAAGWWIASRWYAGDPRPPARHLVGGAIVAAAWVVFFAAFVGLLTLSPADTATAV
jgi:Fas apoptotic inhibitory molecule (FAIM1)